MLLSLLFVHLYFSKKWSVIELAAEVIGGVATVVSLIAGMKNDEDLDDRVKRIMHEEEDD